MKPNFQIEKAHRMAEAFTTHKRKEFLKRFLTDSGIIPPEAIDGALTDYRIDKAFGLVMALSYALGYNDCQSGASIKQLYLAKKHIEPEGPVLEHPLKAKMPGFEI